MNPEDIYNIRKDVGIDKITLLQIYDMWALDFQQNDLHNRLEQYKRTVLNCSSELPEINEEMFTQTLMLSMIIDTIHHIYFGD